MCQLFSFDSLEFLRDSMAICCLPVESEIAGELQWGVIATAAAYCQLGPARHGYCQPIPSNESLFGEPGGFCISASYGVDHCVQKLAT